MAGLSPRPLTVGFAAETDNVRENAQKKFAAKKLDMIIANDVSDRSIGFNSDDNETLVITARGETPLPKMSKGTVARRIIKMIAEAIEPEGSTNLSPENLSPTKKGQPIDG